MIQTKENIPDAMKVAIVADKLTNLLMADERIGLGDAVRSIIAEDEGIIIDGDQLAKTGNAIKIIVK